jgi:hypothetical protein
MFRADVTVAGLRLLQGKHRLRVEIWIWSMNVDAATAERFRRAAKNKFQVKFEIFAEFHVVGSRRARTST